MSPVTIRTRLGYAAGSIASATYGTVPGLLMMPYLTDALGVEAALAGLIVFAPKAWDFVFNPVAGRWSDRTRHPHGRGVFLLWGGVTMAVAFAAMFFGPSAPAAFAGGWVTALFLLAATGFALFQVPYLAMAAEITDDTRERTRLISGRVVVLTLVILAVGATAPMLVDARAGADGYRVMAVVMAAIIALGAVAVWRGTRGAARMRTPAPSGSLLAQVRVALADSQARSLVMVLVVQGVAITMLLSGIAYFARHVLEAPLLSSVIFVGSVAPAILVTPLWSRFAARFGTRRGLQWATMLCATGLALMMAVAVTASVPLLVLAAVILGVGYSGAQLFPLAMLAEVAAADESRTGENRIGVISGVWTGVDLLGSAFGPAIFGAILAFGGYLSSTDALAAQPDSARVAIVVGLALIPALLFAVSLVPLSRFRMGLPAPRLA